MVRFVSCSAAAMLFSSVLSPVATAPTVNKGVRRTATTKCRASSVALELGSRPESAAKCGGEKAATQNHLPSCRLRNG